MTEQAEETEIEVGAADLPSSGTHAYGEAKEDLVDMLRFKRRSSSLDDLDTRQAFGRTLVARLGDATIVRRVEVSPHGWAPTRANCHQNCGRWALEHPGHRWIRGYLYNAFRDVLPFTRFIAHSVVEAPDGELLDITPQSYPNSQPFVRHIGETEDFAWVTQHGHIDVAATDDPEKARIVLEISDRYLIAFTAREPS